MSESNEINSTTTLLTKGRNAFTLRPGTRLFSLEKEGGSSFVKIKHYTYSSLTLLVYHVRNFLVYVIFPRCVKVFRQYIGKPMPELHANNLKLFYERYGKGEPLLLISGFTNHSGMWEKMIPELAKNFEVIVFDNRGAGRSAATPPPYTIEMLADDTIALMDGLSIPATSMVGFSMGGAIIQMIALNHPERIKKGVLLASFSALPKTASMQAINTANLFQAGVDPALALETILPWIYSNEYLSNPSRIKKTLQDLLNNPYLQTPEGYSGQLEALMRFDLTDKLHKIKTDLLIVHGASDLYTPLYSAQVLKEKIQNATLEIIPDMGHMLPFERANEITVLIDAFCKR